MFSFHYSRHNFVITILFIIIGLATSYFLVMTLIATDSIPPDFFQSVANNFDTKRFHKSTALEIDQMYDDLLICTNNSDCTFTTLNVNDTCQYVAGNSYYLNSIEDPNYCVPNINTPFDYVSCTNRFCTKRTIPFLPR